MPTLQEAFTTKYCHNCNKKKPLMDYKIIKCYVKPTYTKTCKVCLEKIRNQPYKRNKKLSN